METNTESLSVHSVSNRQSRIDPKPPYQRGAVWSLAQKQLFIDSILRDYDIPKLYLHRINDERYTWEVLDGQQRLRAIWEFKRNEFNLSSDAEPVGGKPTAQHTYEELDWQLKDALDAYNLTIVNITDASDEEIEEMSKVDPVIRTE